MHVTLKKQILLLISATKRDDQARQSTHSWGAWSLDSRPGQPCGTVGEQRQNAPEAYSIRMFRCLSSR